MPIHIDQMDTSIELTSPSTTAGDAGRPSAVAESATSRETLRDAVMRVLADELERYARIRGH